MSYVSQRNIKFRRESKGGLHENLEARNPHSISQSFHKDSDKSSILKHDQSYSKDSYATMRRDAETSQQRIVISPQPVLEGLRSGSEATVKRQKKQSMVIQEEGDACEDSSSSAVHGRLNMSYHHVRRQHLKKKQDEMANEKSAGGTLKQAVPMASVLQDLQAVEGLPADSQTKPRLQALASIANEPRHSLARETSSQVQKKPILKKNALMSAQLPKTQGRIEQ